MGIYAKYVLPPLIDLAMSNKKIAGLRAGWIPQARGDVLEVGIGSGRNLPYYSAEVRRVWGVDPSAELREMARGRIAASRFPVEYLLQSAERRLPLPDASIDTVVVTATLCSIPDVASALEQMRRVLKPGGRLMFLEHGRAVDPRVVAWQDRLTPLWKRFTGGCHLNRPMDALISAAGFRITELSAGYVPGPRPMTYMYQGFAEPV
ncbi:MAG TPA: class I SAM-dependent methyltransferase [Candidatus Acidoferrales bacterium]|nr:class I SAM-dependent methyltransferase [Candidatus Acidoferrales bacterium]